MNAAILASWFNLLFWDWVVGFQHSQQQAQSKHTQNVPEEGCVVTRAAACHQRRDLCFDYILESCHVHPSLYPVIGRKMHFQPWVGASLATGGPAERWFTVGLWKTNIVTQQARREEGRKGNLVRFCQIMTFTKSSKEDLFCVNQMLSCGWPGFQNCYEELAPPNEHGGITTSESIAGNNASTKQNVPHLQG